MGCERSQPSGLENISKRWTSRPEVPGHPPGIQRNDQQNVHGHAKDDVEQRHEQDRFLQHQGLQQDLKRHEHGEVRHGHEGKKSLFGQSEVENVVHKSI